MAARCRYTPEKMTKYVQLAEEVWQAWQQQEVYVVTLILSNTGVIPMSLSEGLVKLDLPATLGHKMQKAMIIRMM